MLAPDVIEILKAAGLLLIAGPAAFIGGRNSLNGTREKVPKIEAGQAAMARQLERMEAKVDGITEGMAEVRERLARLEAREGAVPHRGR